MKAVLRFRLVLIVFLLWLGFLAYLTFTTARPIVLSRPQFLVSNLVVVAEVSQLDTGEARIQEVYWPKEMAKDFEGKTLRIANLADCQADWTGPGLYIVPLLSDLKSNHRVAPIPPSPGAAANIPPAGLKPRIYSLNSRTRFQLDAMQKPDQLPLPELINP